jgi:hypothetical protein
MCQQNTYLKNLFEDPEPFLYCLTVGGLIYTNYSCTKSCPAERILTVSISNVQYFVISIYKFNKLMLGGTVIVCIIKMYVWRVYRVI